MNQFEFEKKKTLILQYIKSNLKESRYNHTLRVAELAVKMAKDYTGSNDFAQKAEIAALSHDMARNISSEKLSDYIDELKLPERYRHNINLAHGKIAAKLVEAEFGIQDKDIINAISYHTTGRKGMSLLERIVFLADAIEPGRDYEGVDEIRNKTEINIDAGCLESLSRTINYINSRGIYLDPDTKSAYEDIRKGVKL